MRWELNDDVALIDGVVWERQPHMMDYLIQVTDADIKHGVRGSETDCPIARAARHIMSIPHDEELIVTDQYIHTDDDAILLPPEASEFIGKFDAEQPVSPFSFEVESEELDWYEVGVPTGYDITTGQFLFNNRQSPNVIEPTPEAIEAHWHNELFGESDE